MPERNARPTSTVAIARGLLVLAAVVFIGIGVLCGVNPGSVTTLMGLEMPTAVARTDVRAVYGGLMVGIGAFLLWSSLRQRRIQPGLMLAGMSTLGLVGGRMLGFGAEGEVDACNLLFAALELSLTIPAFVLAWRIRKIS
jgi:hypothetical protein